ncbi:MAG TPA: sugar ABC transporter permease [Ktedonobacteraceae bacterium]|nr:sugar ABC transporter permease [Ktedonobacteraceae bacterium]
MATQPVTPSVASAPPITAEGRRRLGRGLGGGSKGRPGETLAAYLFLLPYLTVLGVFIVFVSLYGIGLSLFKVDIGFSVPQFIGTHNYEVIFNQLSDFANSDFWTSMINIIKFVVVIVTVQTILALVLAVLLQNSILKNRSTLRGMFRTIFYIPSLTSSVAVSLIFLWFYNPNGLFNYLLSLVHIPGPQWLQDPNFALPAIMILNIWTTSAAFMIYFMAALQDIPKELVEAAEVDGANRFQSFWNVTVPLLRPSIFLVVALGTIGGFQMFDQVFFMTQPLGGPLNSTLTPMVEIYNVAFSDNHFGLAAAMSVILFVVIFIVTIIQRRFIDPSTSQ